MENLPYRTLADTYITGKTYDIEYNSEEPVFRPLSEAYDTLVQEAQIGVDAMSPEAISAIAGIDSNIILNYYRSIDLNVVMRESMVSVGSPVYRAINKDLHGKQHKDIEKFIGQLTVNYPDKPLIITTATKNRKLRSPVGGRICAFDGLEGMEDILSNPADNPIGMIKRGRPNLLRVLSIIHLIHQFPGKFVQLPKVPAGISYEADQIDEFNNSLEGLPPLPIILPGSRDL